MSALTPFESESKDILSNNVVIHIIFALGKVHVDEARKTGHSSSKDANSQAIRMGRVLPYIEINAKTALAVALRAHNKCSTQKILKYKVVLDQSPPSKKGDDI